jgi:uncharacterized coiled-coil protein SlyX
LGFQKLPIQTYIEEEKMAKQEKSAEEVPGFVTDPMKALYQGFLEMEARVLALESVLKKNVKNTKEALGLSSTHDPDLEERIKKLEAVLQKQTTPVRRDYASE